MSKLGSQNHIKPLRENLAKILANYGVFKFDFKVDPSGVENTTFIITTKEKKYAMRVYRQKRRTEDEIRLEVEYINFLIANKIPVPKIICTVDNYFISHTKIKDKTWRSILMEFIEGNHPSYYSPSLLKELSYLQARMHKLATCFKSELSPVLKLCDTNKKVKDFLFTDLLSVDSIDVSKIKNKEVKNFILRAKNFTFDTGELPIATVQKDIHAANILVKDDKVSGILDFDDLFYGPIVTGSAFALWDIFVKNKNINDLYGYIRNYNSIRKLLPQEINKLKEFLLLRNYIMGVAEFLVGGENSQGTFMMKIDKYFDIEKEIQKLTIQNYGKA